LEYDRAVANPGICLSAVQIVSMGIGDELDLLGPAFIEFDPQRGAERSLFRHTTGSQVNPAGGVDERLLLDLP
jgi:hypothetical protein